jgi:predicted transcriptional regulator of viral defense system
VNFKDLLSIVGREPVFSTGLLLAGQTNPNYVRRQLTEWVNTGKVWQLRRGLYTLAPPHQKVKPHPFLVANRMVNGSYVSKMSALAYFGHVPEFVALITSVTTGRPGEWETPLGHFVYQHLQPGMFFGYQRIQVAPDQFAYIATPEKALLDLVYLQPGGDDRAYLESLRLQNLDQFDLDKMWRFVEKSGRPKLIRAVQEIADLSGLEAGEYEIL